MSDIFISYAREDEERIRPLAAALEAHGWSVFWDRRIPAGQTWRSVLGQKLHDAKCVIVAWSHHSVASRWVLEEADAGLQRGILVPVLLDQVEPPIGFRSLQAAEFAAWPVDSDSPAFTQFVQDVRKVLGSLPPPRTVPAEPWVGKRPSSSRTALAGLAVILLVLAGAAYFYLTRVSEPAKGGAHSTISTVLPGSVPASTGGAAAPAAAGAPPSSGSPGSEPEALAIKIGDKVSDGVPAPGAGLIARPFEHDVYRFTAAPRQTVYFRVWEISATLSKSYLGWRLADQDGTEVFKQGLYTGSPGVHTLVRGGTYTLTVGSNEDAAIGLYQFQLYDVPRPDQFAIELGARIRDGQPGPGAGDIATPGAKDVYTFKAAPRQKVFFRVWEISATLNKSYLGWRLADQDGTEVFKQGLYTGSPGVHTLVRGGTYTLTVGSNEDAAIGLYQFQLYDVPRPDQFAIELGARIRDGQPGPGAGNIATPGAKDVYTFKAAPRQKVSFRVLGASPAIIRGYLGWRLVDEDGTEIFKRGLYAGHPGVHTLMKGGTYTLTVGSDIDPATGTYDVQIDAQN